MLEQLLLNNYWLLCLPHVISFSESNGKWELLKFRILLFVLRVCWNMDWLLFRASSVDLKAHMPAFETLLMLLSKQKEYLVFSKTLWLSLAWQLFEQASADTLHVFLDSCSLSGPMWNKTRLWRRWMWCLHCYDIQVWSLSEENHVSFTVWTLQQRNGMGTDPGSWHSRCGTIFKKCCIMYVSAKTCYFTFGT